MEAARKTQLAKGEVGIKDRKPAPTLKEFALRFERAIEIQCAEKPNTIDFYKKNLKRLLANEQLTGTRIDAIDEAAVEAYVQARSRVKSAARWPFPPVQ
jgi:site-specific recombinase XerD